MSDHIITNKSLMQRCAITALVGFAIGSAALAIYPQTSHAQGLLRHNSNAPVDYSANRIELQDRQDRVVLSGNVDIRQAGLTLRAARVTVAYRNVGGIDIDRISATGNVTVNKGNERASGNAAIYDLNRRIITLIGNVSLQRGGDTLRGGRLTIDLTTGLSSVDGRAAANGTDSGSAESSGRVSGSFSVPQREDNN